METRKSLSRIYRPIRALTLASILIASTGCDERVPEEKLFETAQSALEANNAQAAIIHLKNLLKSQPDNLAARLLLAKTYQQTGDHASAEKELRFAQRLGTDDEWATLALVDALAKQAKYRELVTVDPLTVTLEKRGPVYTQQARAYAALGETEKAIEAIDNAVKLNPESAEAHTTQAALLSDDDMASAEELAREIVHDHPDYAPAWSLLARIERASGNLAEAEEAFNQAITLEETFAELYLRAMVRIALDKLDDAQTDIDKARVLQPKYYELDFAQGLLDYRLGNIEGAKASLQEAYSRNNNFLPAIFYLAAVNFRLGFLEEAENLAYNYVFKNSSYLPANRLLADIYLRRGKYEEAEHLITPLAEKNPQNIGVWSQLADALRGQGKRTQELTVLEKMADLAPDSLAIQYRIGSTLVFLEQDTARGLAMLKNALSKNPNHFDPAKDLVAYYSKTQDHAKAIETANQFLSNNPHSTTALNLVGLALAAKGDIKGANKSFEQALELAPGDPATNNNLATLAIRQKDFNSARKYLDNVIEKFGPDYSTLINLASLDSLEKKDEEMIAHLQQALEINPDNPAPSVALARHYLSQNQAAKARQVFGELANKFPKVPQILQLSGQIQLANSDLGAAENTFKELIQLTPEQAEGHYLLARVYARRDLTDLVTQELNTTLNLNPNHFLARLNLAQILLQEGKSSEVKTHLTKLKAIAPDNVELTYLDGLVARQSGDMNESLNYFKQVLESVENTKAMLSVAQQEWDLNEHTLAIARVENWLKTHKNDNAARLYLAKFYSAQNRNSEAIEQYKAILKQTPDSVIALNNIAWEMRESQSEKAQNYAQRAYELSNRNSDIGDTLAVILMNNKDYDRALEVSDVILQKTDMNKSPALFYHRAQILAQMGRKTEAHQLLEQLLATDTKFKEKSEAKALLNALQ